MEAAVKKPYFVLLGSFNSQFKYFTIEGDDVINPNTV